MNLRTINLLLVLLAALLLVGCSEDDPANPQDTSQVTIEKDVAEAIASDLGSEDGGLVDQLSDAVSFAGSVDLVAKSGDCEGLRSAEYDDVTGTWTITIERERGEPDDVPYALITRVYTVRFLDESGQAQERYMVDGVAARTIEFAILSGEGEHRTNRLEQTLDQLEGAFVITDAHTELVTVNGNYLRSGTNHLETEKFSRDHASTLTLELIDVQAPRGAARDLSDAVSGTVTGTYEASITVERGDEYVEKEIFREFSIELGDGEGLVTMERKRYRARLRTGELEGE